MMKRTNQMITLMAVLFLFCSCASTYQSVSPEMVNHVSKDENKKVYMEYQYAPLNKKYKKKQERNSIRLVSVKLTNDSDKPLTVGEDLKFSYTNGKLANTLTPEETYKSMKQGTLSYLLYLLLTPMQFNVIQDDGQEDSTPIGLVVGPAVTAGNVAVSATANKKFKEELETYNLQNKTIAPGETKFGILGLQSDSYDALMLQIE